jgi:hypothetical protein
MILKPEDPTVTSNLDHTGCGMKGRSMRVSEGEVQGPTRIGRRPSTSHDELQRAAFTLFADTGFDETSIDDIAASVGSPSAHSFAISHPRTTWCGAISTPN